MEEFIQLDIQQRIKKCMNVYGIEGTLEKIEELYKNMPTLKELWITEFWNIIKGK